MKLKVFYQEDHKLTTKIIDTFNTKLLPQNIIKIKEQRNLMDYLSLPFSSYTDVVDIFKELNIILNTNLSLSQSIEILLQGNQNPKIQQLLLSIQNALKNATPVYIALEKHKRYIGELPILFFKLGENNADIKNSINALSIILIENQQSKKQFINSLSYPLFLTFTLFVSVVIIFNFVIPQFEHIFMQYGDKLPLATSSLLFVKTLFVEFYYIFLIFIAFTILSVKYFYIKNITFFDKVIALNIPLVSRLYCQFIFYRFFLSLSMLVKSNYQFQTAFQNTLFIIKNRYILYQLNQVLSNINNGTNISEAFSQTKLFDPLTTRLLHTAQQTNTLPKILANITTIYKQKLDDNIKYFTSAIGPIFILILSIFTLWVILAIMMPSLSIGTILN